MDTHCIICGKDNFNVPKYDTWKCKKCNQEYIYEEGYSIILSDEQIILLKRLNNAVNLKLNDKIDLIDFDPTIRGVVK